MARQENKDKNAEIREYSIRENIFFATLLAGSMTELFERFPKEEVMAVVIELSEQFEDEFADGNTEQLEDFVRTHLKSLLNS